MGEATSGRRRKGAFTSFGKMVRKKMIDMDMSYAELSEIAGVRSPSYICDILTGRRSGDKYMAVICDALGIAGRRY